MKFKLAAMALLCSAAIMCSEANADLLGRMLGRGGCGGCDTVSSCCDTPAPACGGRNLSITLNIGLPGRLFNRGGCGGGLLSRGCGCSEAPAVAPVVEAGCGCDAAPADSGCGCRGGLLGTLRARMGGGCGCGAVEAPAADCGCQAAPAPTCGPTCGDDGGCGCGGGLFKGGLLGRLGSRFGGGCGCGAVEAPAADCGCSGMLSAAPVEVPAADCGCAAEAPACGGQLRGRVRGLLSRLRPSGNCGGCGAPAGDCGCAPAPAPAPACGCDAAPAADCGCGSRLGNLNLGSRLKARCGGCGRTSCDGGCGGSRMTLINRLRGDRVVRGCGTNNGCQPACPNSGCDTGCSSCSGAVQYNSGTIMAPTQIMSPAPSISAPATTQPSIEPVPAAVPSSTEGNVIVPKTDGAARQPVVDPSAFVIRKK